MPYYSNAIVTIYSAVFFGATFFIGSIFGSFFWTLALRFSKIEDFSKFAEIFYKPSRCPECLSAVKTIFLIPIFGYFLSKKKCPFCGKNISAKYLFSEIFFGLLLCVIIADFGLSLDSILKFFVLSLSLVIAFIDYKTMKVPHSLLFSFLILSLINLVFWKQITFPLFGFALMFGAFFLIMIFFPGGFGGGDLKYASVLGLFSGLYGSIVILETALITGSIFGIFYALVTKKGFRVKIPFTPFLTIGLFVSIFFGNWIILTYQNFL